MTSSSLRQPGSGLSGPQAYSDEGRRRKQSGSRRDPIAADSMQVARQLFET
jgi:hypothetical protein